MSVVSFENAVKSYGDTVYRVALNILKNPADTEGVYVKSVSSSAGGVKVETFVPEGAEYSKSGIIASVADESGNSLYFIMGEREKVDGGYIHIQYFESAKGEITGLRVYDKNTTDTEGNPCVLWETENPRFE